MEEQENSKPVYVGVQVLLLEGAEKRESTPQSCTCSGDPLLNPRAYKKVVRKSDPSCTSEDAAHR
ncbi:MAG: hypothetical protein HXS48_17525 [Theionarchaea archaeon]|nr:MAG: hypothetical protein AYK19_15365 [Theionarchaea archaeon DG-70-1]MBU7028739.1 hypothetical protein [Theionarchaea archaeon]